MSRAKNAPAPRSTREIKELYEQGANIMDVLRAGDEAAGNSLQAVRLSYDLQAGSYVKSMEAPGAREFQDARNGEIVDCLRGLAFDSLLEAGCGEATTLAGVLRHMQAQPARVLGFDLSWSRIRQARLFARGAGVRAELFVAAMEHIPLPDNACDLVLTSHAVEPNLGRERAILSELYRVARRHVALFEPCYELAVPEQREHMERNRYCRNLAGQARDLGFNVLRHHLLERTSRGRTALLLLEKPDSGPGPGPGYACPLCRTPLVGHLGHWFCPECFLVFPVLGGIPCLDPSCGILAGQFLETEAEEAGPGEER